jgi:hypothetical protein
MEFDKEQVVCIALYLEGTMITWYNDNVDSMDHQNNIWLFKMVITSLYDQFVHHIDNTQTRNPNKIPKMSLFSIIQARGRL